MSNSLESSLPTDIPLLLRADAEQCWLHREVIPALHHLESAEELPEEQVGAALAYLEAMWNEATLRAHKTDAAHSDLYSGGEEPETLAGPARRYHTAVRALRGMLAERIRRFVQPPLDGEQSSAASSSALRLGNALENTNGRAPRAA